MYILGLSCYYHDSSAALLKDGVLVAAAQEERFTRVKHDVSFPEKAIEYCLDSQGITIDDIDLVGFYEKPLLKFERILNTHFSEFPKSLKTFLVSTPSLLTKKLRILSKIRKLKYRGDVMFVNHHMAHAAGSFLISPFKKAAILTVDGVGEWNTTTYGKGNGNEIELSECIDFPHSLGLLYSTITAYLGFTVNNSEYKVMGLAPYGLFDRKKNKYYRRLRKVIDIKPDGSYRLDLSYFTFHQTDRMPSRKLCLLLGSKVRSPESKVTQRHKDIAAALQMVTEDVMFAMLAHLHKKTGLDDLVMSGGVALNSVCNGKILRNTPFKRIWIQPDPGDGGTSVGTLFYIWNTVLGKKRTYELKDAFLGPGYDDKQIMEFLSRKKIKHSEFSDEKELTKKVAKLIFNDNVIGWFQGRMEWGPRALGSRSILSNPCNPKMQEILNLKVKHREKFRPFAPVVCADDAADFFDCDEPVPVPTDFMLMVYPVFPKWHKKIPSVTHVDGSGRLQTIRRNQNRLYHDLIKEFGKLSKIPILVNTSFNIRGEPIVCTPEHAYRCMMGTGIDYVVMGKYLIKRDDNPKDIWDSENLAID